MYCCSAASWHKVAALNAPGFLLRYVGAQGHEKTRETVVGGAGDQEGG